MSKDKTKKKNPADVVSVILFGFGLALGVLPIAVVSLIISITFSLNALIV